MVEVLFLEIEGVGVVIGSVAYTHRFTTRVPTSAAVPGRYITGMDLPNSVSAAVDPLKNTVSQSGLQILIPATVSNQSIFYKTYFKQETAIKVVVDYLDTNINVEDSAAVVVDDLIWVNTEAMRVTVIVNPDTITVVRAQLGTQAENHAVGDDVFTDNHLLPTRRATLYSTDDDETTPLIRWSGLLTDVKSSSSNGLAAIGISFRSSVSWLSSKFGADRWSSQISTFNQISGAVGAWVYLRNLSDESQPVRTISTAYAQVYFARTGAYPDPISREHPTVGACRIGKGVFSIVSQQARGQYFAKIGDDQTRPILGESILGDKLGNLPRFADEVLVSDPQYSIFYRYDISASDYESVPIRNPILITLFLLLTTGDNTNFDPADGFSYDLPVSGNWGLAMPRDMVDVDTFEALASGIYADATVPRFEGHKGEALDTIEKLMSPLGLFIVQSTVTGQLTPVGIGDVAPASIVTQIVTGDLDSASRASYDRNFKNVFDEATIEWADGEPDSVVLAKNIRWYRGSGSAAYEVDAQFYERAGGTARDHVTNTARAMSIRFLWPMPEIRVTVKPSIAETITVGSLVQFSHVNMVDSTGTTTLVNGGCVVIEENILFGSAGAKELLLWYVGHDIQTGLIGPSIEVRDYDIAIKQVNLYNDGVMGDTTWFEVDDRLILLSASGEQLSEPSKQLVKVKSKSGSSDIVLDFHFQDAGSTVIYPRSGNIIIGVNYNWTNNDETDRFFYLANAAGLLSSGTVDGYQYAGGFG